MSNLQIVLTRKESTVSGGVTRGGKPITDYRIIVFPEDKSRWGLQSLRVRGAVPDQDGRFRIPGAAAWRIPGRRSGVDGAR